MVCLAVANSVSSYVNGLVQKHVGQLPLFLFGEYSMHGVSASDGLPAWVKQPPSLRLQLASWLCHPRIFGGQSHAEIRRIRFKNESD